MFVPKRCTITLIITLALIIVLVVNVLLYFIVDTGLIFTTTAVTGLRAIETTAPSKSPIHKEEFKSNGASNLHLSPKNEKTQVRHPQAASIKAAETISAHRRKLGEMYTNKSKDSSMILSRVLTELRVIKSPSANLWTAADQWATGVYTIPEHAPLLGSLLDALCSSKIVKADNSMKGTQLKISLALEGGHRALFKPQWYKREETIPGPVYAGKDRHNAEVAAFHLSLLLGLRRVPLTVGRRVDLRREILPVATPNLLETFFQEGNNTCFYGVCMYCKPSDPVCAKRDIMEGALILWLPSRLQFSRFAHPWQRSYRNNVYSRWESEERYCEKIIKLKQYSQPNHERLLDIIDAAIFDFLLSNGDRHHYEMPDKVNPASIFLFDNGKSFGDADQDFFDILAPLYQCCMLRLTTWKRLLILKGGALSHSLKQTLRTSHIAPVLSDNHLKSLDRRLLLVFSTVELCFQEKGKNSVLR